MAGDYPDDTFTQTDVENELDRAGLKHYDKGRYLLAQCPTHEDQHPSVQIYKDDWFVNCHAACGRFHITKAFPELRQNRGGYTANSMAPARKPKEQPMTEHKYKSYDLLEYWQGLKEIPTDHVFKGIPIDILNDLGWRWIPENNQYFIPYFSASKGSIPFAQYRNLGENPNPRFIFLKDAKPTCYGTWNLDNQKLFVCEGTSDAAVLDFCAVPWIALPSAASGTLMQSMAAYCKENGIQLVYAGDNDAAGDKLREALDSVMPYRVKQPPKKYKDWGEFFESEGLEAVQNYCFEELNGPSLPEPTTIEELFPGAEPIKMGDDPFESKELPGSSPQVSF